MTASFKEMNARRGLSPRQSRLLDLEALIEGTGYATLADWSAEDEKGNPLPCSQRAPAVQLGVVAEKALKLVRALTGKKGLPTIAGCDELAAEIEQMNLRATLPLAVKDMIRGSGVLGFARLGDASSGPFEPLYMETTWCEPLFVCHARTVRARQIAAELTALGVPIMTPQRGVDLFVPDGSDSQDVIFLRHEWVVDAEVAQGGGSARVDTVRTLYRRDYLPNVIVEYVPQTITGADLVPLAWRLDSRPRPHNWGVVPISWGRSPWAKPGEVDGPPFIRPEVLSLSKAADYVESMATDSVKKIAWPQLAIIDGKDARRDINRENDPGAKEARMSSGSDLVIELQSRPGGQQAKAEILEINGEGPKVAHAHVDRLVERVGKLTGMVEFDQSKAAGVMSGEAIERLLSDKIDVVNEWRTSAETMLVTLLKKLARVAGKTIKPEIQWPEVVAPTPPDIAQIAQAVTAATGGQPIVSQETGARLFARLTGATDIDEELKRLGADAKNADAALARAREALTTPKAAAAASPDASGQ